MTKVKTRVVCEAPPARAAAKGKGIRPCRVHFSDAELTELR